MNNYLIFINGILMPNALFQVETQTSATAGRFMQLTAAVDKLKEESDKIRRIDVMEVRASSTIRRYEYLRPGEGADENFKTLPANEETNIPVRARFRLFGIANAF